MKLKGLLLFFLSFFAFFYTEAQDYNYRHFTTRDGLPSMMVYDILQDKKGFIWLATSEGVARFDGYRFKTFTIDNGLSDNDVIGVSEGTDGKIWVVPFQKHLAYILNDSVYEHQIKGLTSSHKAVEADSLGYLWISTTNGDLYQCTDTIVRHFEKAHYSSRLSSVLRGIGDNNGNVWIGSDDSLIKVTDKVTHWYCGKYSDEAYKAQAIPFLGANGDVYLQGFYKVYRFTGRTLSNVVETYELANDAIIIRMSIMNDGGLLICTSKGVFQVSFENGKKVIQPFLAGHNVSNAIEDREGNIWFTTLNNGVYLLTKGSRQVINLGEKNGLPPDKPFSLFAIDSSVYISYTYGTLRKLGLSSNTYHFDTVPFHVLYSNLSECITIPHHGRWCMGLAGILQLGDTLPGQKANLTWYNRLAYQPIKGVFHYKNYDLVNLGAVKGFAFDNDSLFWIACNDGIYTVDYKSNSDYFTLDTRFVERTSSIVYQASRQYMWFASGPHLYYFTNDSIKHYTHLKNKSNINKLYLASNNDLIVGTSGEGVFIVRDSTHIYNINSHHSLPSNLVNHILEIPDGLLISTSRGLCHLNHQYQAIPVQFNDGLEGEEVKKTMLVGDRLFMLTNKGLSVVPIEALKPDTLSPLVHIATTNIAGADTVVLPAFVLPYDKNNIRLEYVGVLHKSQGKLLYRYQMEGVDTAWIQTSFTNVQYPTLPPGMYKFKVDARSYQGPWSNNPATMSITILPPFWQTWWFRALTALVILAVVTGISYAVIRYYRNQSKIAQRMVELESQALRANMNPHFVFNALNAIHDFIANQDERSAHLYLGKFAQLIRRILDQSRRNFISLEEELDTLKLYLELENMRFEHKFGFEVQVDTDILPYDIEIPPMLIQPYIENAIRHGLMEMDRTGKITVAFERNEIHLICTVTDNGIGREKAQQLGSNRLKKHRSMGMEITQKRVELLNNPEGKDKDRGVTIIDLYHQSGQAAGTQVRLLLPIKDL